MRPLHIQRNLPRPSRIRRRQRTPAGLVHNLQIRRPQPELTCQRYSNRRNNVGIVKRIHNRDRLALPVGGCAAGKGDLIERICAPDLRRRISRDH